MYSTETKMLVCGRDGSHQVISRIRWEGVSEEGTKRRWAAMTGITCIHTCLGYIMALGACCLKIKRLNKVSNSPARKRARHPVFPCPSYSTPPPPLPHFPTPS